MELKTCYSHPAEWMLKFPTDQVNSYWSSRLESGHYPSFTTGVIKSDFKDLVSILSSHNTTEIFKIIDALVDGKFLIIKNVLDSKQILKLKEEFNNLKAKRPQSFQKILDGVTNFWRNITEEHANKYAVPQIKTTSYWFPFDPESKEVYKHLELIYRSLKALGGRSPIEYESNLPSNGPVDRIQIVEYPAGSGKLDAHHDPDHNQRLIMSGYLSKRGVDFFGGGFWALGEDGDKINLEDDLFPGDFGTCYANLTHGVDSSLPNIGSRWFVGLYSNDSDYKVEDRKTIRSASIS